METIKPLEFCVNVTIPSVDSSGLSLYQCVGALAEAVKQFADQLNAAGLNKLSGDTIPLHAGGGIVISASVETALAQANAAVTLSNNNSVKLADAKKDIEDIQESTAKNAENVNSINTQINIIKSENATNKALIQANTRQINLNQQDNIINKSEIKKLNNLIFQSESAVMPSSQVELKNLHESGTRLIIADQGNNKMKIGYIVKFIDRYEVWEVG